ncbi:STM3941 family protein [Fusobacterium sp. PH5-44]|uniref:STM3941 family protein n=1 Tax=unclassified Fusobacterium TaxID=2648384 RepID=UPI003D1A9A1D
MSEIIIKFDNKKRIKSMILGALVISSLALLALFLIFIPNTIYIFPIIFSVVGFILGLVAFFISLKNFFSKNKNGLILSNDGIVFNGTPNGRKIGKILWKDINYLNVKKVYNSYFVFLKLNSLILDKYMINIGVHGRTSILNDGVGITNDELDITFDKMRKLIEDYFIKNKV